MAHYFDMCLEPCMGPKGPFRVIAGHPTRTLIVEWFLSRKLIGIGLFFFRCPGWKLLLCKKLGHDLWKLQITIVMCVAILNDISEEFNFLVLVRLRVI